MGLLKQRGDEIGGVEGNEIVDPLAHAHVLHRQLQFVGDGKDDAALGGAVQLGQDDTRKTRGLQELLGLDQAVLAASGSSRSMTRRIFASSFIRFCLLCRRPAVSTMITSLPRALAAQIPS